MATTFTAGAPVYSPFFGVMGATAAVAFSGKYGLKVKLFTFSFTLKFS